ncbi:FtsX-like permease family protein [Lentilactobacillus sp. Marseille-Q4993]|uniref:ABC transporter permease n=1 Tax=Lentilactobacillus sp. Marseille-Q4993 TaxID=3039492 RepID=UPI0024BD307C|nr:FtsX-like permease family protein [Lentilactobacillus sp. Marseille-Q4993]
MFLALKEMKHEKFRYSLIISMVVLIGYLIYVLTSLSIGLARQNTTAIESWNTQTVALNKDSNINLDQSVLMKGDINSLDKKNDAVIGETPVVAKTTGQSKQSARYIGLSDDQYIYKTLDVTSGKKSLAKGDVIVDEAFKTNGYKLGDTLKLNSSNQKFKIVGFTKDAKIDIAPIIYGDISHWNTLKNYNSNIVGSAVISKSNSINISDKHLKNYKVGTVINKLPGYSAQNTTFELMIGFLMVISVIVIAVFLYILTMQKLKNYAVMRAQGIPANVLVKATIAQSFIIVAAGLLISAVLATATALVLPAAVPIFFDVPVLAAVSAALIALSLLAALIPVRSILKVDPVTVIGG